MAKKTKVSIKSQSELLKLEEKYCSWGDTVHYSKEPKIFDRAQGCYLYDDGALNMLICKCGIPRQVSATAMNA